MKISSHIGHERGCVRYGVLVCVFHRIFFITSACARITRRRRQDLSKDILRLSLFLMTGSIPFGIYISLSDLLLLPHGSSLVFLLFFLVVFLLFFLWYFLCTPDPRSLFSKVIFRCRARYLFIDLSFYSSFTLCVSQLATCPDLLS